MKKILITIVIAATLIGCSDDDQKSYPPPTTGGSGNEVGTAQIWVTSGDESRLLSAQDHLSIIDNKETSYPSITIICQIRTASAIPAPKKASPIPESHHSSRKLKVPDTRAP